MHTTLTSPGFSRLERTWRVFDRLWMVSGKPVARVIDNERSWATLSDIRKDPILDAYVNSDGMKVRVDTLWCWKDIPILSSGEDGLSQEVEFGGRFHNGSLGFYTKAEHRPLIEDSFRIILDNSQYYVDDIRILPHTVTKMIVVSLNYWSGDMYGCGGI